MGAMRLWLLPLLLPALACSSAAIVLEGGTCIRPCAEVAARCTVVVDRDGTAHFEMRPRRVFSQSTRVIDARGTWIVPSFVDNHVHLGRVEPHREDWLRAGVTRLVENGSGVSPKELHSRYPSGPAISPCGPIITAVNGYPALIEGGPISVEVSGAVDAAHRAAELLRTLEPRCLKIAVERGFRADLDEEGWPAFDRAEVEAIVGAAQRAGVPVLAHVTQSMEFDLAVNAGVRVIAHAPLEPIPDASLREARDRGVAMVSTVALWKAAGLQDPAVDNLVRYARIGGAIAIGSDYPNWKTPGLPLAELLALQEGGLDPGELLTALTRSVIDGCDRNDFVVLGSDPRQSLDALSDVRIVIHEGRVVFEEGD